MTTPRQQYLAKWDVTELVRWVGDYNRKAADIAFTEGPARQVAYALDAALKRERETTSIIPPLILRSTEQCPRCGYIAVVRR